METKEDESDVYKKGIYKYITLLKLKNEQERQKAEKFKEEVSRQLFSRFEHTDNDFIDRTIKELWEEIYDGN